MDVEAFLEKQLKDREIEGIIRKLTITNGLTDFTSNDYLGLSRSSSLKNQIEEEYNLVGRERIGATGSRLLSGNNAYVEKLEAYLSQFWNQEALLFNSGYNANLGLFSTLAQEKDTYILDEWIHASIIDGVRLSKAKREIFKHNDIKELEEKLKISQGNKFVIVESLYSMDGDFCPLVEISQICHKYNAYLIVDEAHSTGIYGNLGKGRVNELGLENKVYARIFTFGKALGVHGAVVVGSKNLKSFLINFARSFIFTTALPNHTLCSIFSSWEYLKTQPNLKDDLFLRISQFRKEMKLNYNKTELSPIQAFIIKGNENAKKLAQKMNENGFDIRPILYPSVPKGKERIRICIHAFNSTKEIEKLTHTLKQNLINL